MKVLIVASVLLTGVLAAPQNFDQQNFNSAAANQVASIVRYFFDWYPNGEGYKYTYELSDGQIRSEEGRYKDSVDADGSPVKILVVQGAYSFVGNDGETYWTNYQADENGYRPKTGKGVGGIRPGDDAGIDPNLLKSLVG